MEENKYKILAFPKKKPFEYDYIYYRIYSTKKTTLISLPEGRTLYVVRFSEPFTSNDIKKIFGIKFKIEEVHIGNKQIKHNNKKKRRVIYFALVIFNNEEAIQYYIEKSNEFQAAITQKFGSNIPKLNLDYNPIEENEQNIDEDPDIDKDGFIIIKEGKKSANDTGSRMKSVTLSFLERIMEKKDPKKSTKDRLIVHENIYEPAKKRKKRTGNLYYYQEKDAKRKSTFK